MFITFNIEGLEVKFQSRAQIYRAVCDAPKLNLIKLCLKHSCRPPDFIQSFFNKTEDKVNGLICILRVVAEKVYFFAKQSNLSYSSLYAQRKSYNFHVFLFKLGLHCVYDL